jgi:hypothetical protein
VKKHKEESRFCRKDIEVKGKQSIKTNRYRLLISVVIVLMLFSQIALHVFATSDSGTTQPNANNERVHQTSSLNMKSDSLEATESELDVDEFIELDEAEIDLALEEVVRNNEVVEHKIASLDDLYGKFEFPVDNQTIAKMLVASEFPQADFEDFDNFSSVSLSVPIELMDANDMHVFNAYNFTIAPSGVNGYIVVAIHSKAPLLKEIKTGITLPLEFSDSYYLSEGEFYFAKADNYTMLSGGSIPSDEFNELLMERKKSLYNFTEELLASIELDTVSMVNNIAYLTNVEKEDLMLEKSYNGQDSSAYGYGGINNITNYLKDRYGGTVSYSSGKMLSMNNFTMKDLGDGSICTLTSITRILKYYYDQGYTKIDSSRDSIFKKVKAKAKKYGFTEKSGTFPTKINNIVQDVLRDYGYKKSYSNGVYVWTFSGQVKKEIDANRPVIMNIARGYYGNHSVTVDGYKIYKTSKKILLATVTKTHNMIGVYDGWTSGQRYIDYEAFAYDLIHSGFGSFNTVIVKS